MGNLLRIITNRFEGNREDNSSDVFVDFENCQPSDDERELWNGINAILKRSDKILEILGGYSGAVPEIRDAIKHYEDVDIQRKAWQSMVPCIQILRQCYDFAVEIAETVPKLLSALSTSEMTVNEHLEKQQALFKQFAEILDFVLKFDDLKMMKPSVQNDFSFYRRTCSRRKSSSSSEPFDEVDAEDILADEYCSKISLFYAEPNPLLVLVSKYTSQWRAGDKSIPVDVTTDCLASMANICRGLVQNPDLRSRLTQDDTQMLCLRVMTAVVILYDHVDPNGVFRKYSKVDVKSCIRLLKEQDSQTMERLLSALRYSTLHFNDESTPKQIKQMLTTS